ncbi:hypothetical protein XA68_13729 [Ophiocordyceps unilateralis]|uniref:ABC transporter domain-containing protein n=1 Tax=Ophiocordyceps unilateralis TaxID=268505 RepID=A0A2A9PAR6_OPHUN|nr:hypothetical protein XA68_13729 [Ophiocordyceps unilateralis]
MRQQPFIRILNGTLSHRSATRQSYELSNISFELPWHSDSPCNWCVVGPAYSGKTSFLRGLRGELLCRPSTARSYPHLSRGNVPARLRDPQVAIRYVGFNSGQAALGGEGNVRGSYMSARYESKRDATDFSLREFLLGRNQVNPPAEGFDESESPLPADFLDQTVKDLGLSHLLDLPFTFLSNGQARRARIARAILTRPALLLLDEPFMGLDPATAHGLSSLLESMAAKASPRLLISARPNDPLPEWITHLVYLRTGCKVVETGPKDFVLSRLQGHCNKTVGRGNFPEDQVTHVRSLLYGTRMPSTLSEEEEEGKNGSPTGTAFPQAPVDAEAEPLVELDGCQVRYGDKVALGDWTQQSPEGNKAGMVWTIRRGERWGVFGPNGSGKTTLVSLICADHPQAFALPMKLLGSSLLPKPDSEERPLTYWDLQMKVGVSSPEVHQLIPRSYTIRQVLESPWWRAPTINTGHLPRAMKRRILNALLWFTPELWPEEASRAAATLERQQCKIVPPRITDIHKREQKRLENEAAKLEGTEWANERVMSELSFSAQRVVLFLRAILKSPDIVVLDEAFGGMDAAVRDKCMSYLAEGLPDDGKPHPFLGLTDRQALVCISHVHEEVPDCVKDWICLPEAGSGLAPRFGRLERPLANNEREWNGIWGL